MKKIIIISILSFAVVFTFADGRDKDNPTMMRFGMGWGWMQEDFMHPDFKKLLDSQENRKLGSLTVADVRKLIIRIEELKIASRYIEKSGKASFVIPGLGQFINDKPVSGALFLTAHLGIVAGTLAGGYFLLPNDLQFGGTDYLNENINVITDRWKSHSINEYLPSVAVFAGGHVLDIALRLWSSANARKLAAKRVRERDFKVKPYFRGTKRGFGFGMGMKW